MGDVAGDGRRGHGEGQPEYAIAGTYMEFLRWRNQDLNGRQSVTYLDTPERCEGREPGNVYRIGTWERSPAREAAERLEV